MDEEDDEARVDREITELTEQSWVYLSMTLGTWLKWLMFIYSECYSKAEILRQKQELLRQKRLELKKKQMPIVSTTTNAELDQSSDSEQEELEEFLNWRSKVV